MDGPLGSVVWHVLMNDDEPLAVQPGCEINVIMHSGRKILCTAALALAVMLRLLSIPLSRLTRRNFLHNTKRLYANVIVAPLTNIHLCIRPLTYRLSFKSDFP